MRERARTLAHLSVATGLPPSEIRAMTLTEINAYAEALREAHDG